MIILRSRRGQQWYRRRTVCKSPLPAPPSILRSARRTNLRCRFPEAASPARIVPSHTPRFPRSRNRQLNGRKKPKVVMPPLKRSDSGSWRPANGGLLTTDRCEGIIVNSFLRLPAPCIPGLSPKPRQLQQPENDLVQTQSSARCTPPNRSNRD